MLFLTPTSCQHRHRSRRDRRRRRLHLFQPGDGARILASPASSPRILRTKTRQYQNGIEFHFDWGASQFLSKQVSSALSDMPISRSPTILEATRSLTASSHVLGVGNANRIYFPDRKDAGISEPEGLRRVPTRRTGHRAGILERTTYRPKLRQYRPGAATAVCVDTPHASSAVSY